MAEQLHHIKKQIYEIRLKDRNRFFEIQDKISSMNNFKIMKIIDEVFKEYFSEDETVLIDKLEIDIGKISEADLEMEFPELIKKKLTEYFIDKKLKQSFYDGKKNLDISGNPVVQAVDADDGFSAEHLLSKEDYLLNIISYFLTTGTMPWYAEKQTVDFEEEINNLIRTSPDKTKNMFREIISSETVRERIAKQFSNEIILRIAGLFISEAEEIIVRRFDEINLIFDKYLLNKEVINFLNYIFRLTIIELLYDYSNHLKNDKYLSGYFINLIIKKSYKSEEILNQLKTAIDKIKLEENLPSEHFITVLNEAIATIPGKKDTSTNPNEDKNTKDNSSFETRGLIRDLPDEGEKEDEKITKSKEIEKTLTEKIFDEKNADEILDNEIYINNSGLVIIAPFLKLFFQNIKLLEEDNFPAYEEQIKAVHILQYLADGTENNQEHLLSLNKLLCGLDISFPIEKEVAITDTEKKECDKLLSSIIEHWSALKNISIMGLRESFLIRDGILEVSNVKALLRVEPKAYDMLIDKMPWGFSIIKFPWMKKPLNVEWRTA